jgi:anaerobic ribonucleoside-triphosphate reductase
LNFQAHGQNRNEIRFNYIEKNGNQTFVFPFSDIHETLPRFFQGWRLVKDYKSHTSEIVDFLNQRVQESKIS